MAKKLPKCPNCDKCCVNYRKGWACAKKDAISNSIYLRIRKSKNITTIERGWIHVHAGMPYSKLFGTKKECLKDIAYKANNSPLSRARRATIKTIKTWE